MRPEDLFGITPPANEVGRDPPDDPDAAEHQHTVTLTRAFWLKTTEVTQGEWLALMANSPSWFSACGSTCPVEQVFLFDAMAYVNALSASQGLTQCYGFAGCTGTPGIDYNCPTMPTFAGSSCDGYRLPTEAEWEFAARAGTTTATYNGNITQTGSGPEPVLQSIAWFVATSAGKTRPVAQRGANAWGLFDMLGNVAEWVHDGFTTHGFAPVVDPIGAWDEGMLVRGGAWKYDARHCRAAWRGVVADIVRLNVIGFRVARTIP